MKNKLSRETRRANANRGWTKRRAREQERALMTVQEAAAAGVDRLRDPRWVGAFDHFKIDIFDGRPGPWVHLYSPANVEINGRDPVTLLITQLTPGAKGLPYEGPLPDSKSYRAEVESWRGRTERLARGKS